MRPNHTYGIRVAKHLPKSGFSKAKKKMSRKVKQKEKLSKKGLLYLNLFGLSPLNIFMS